jgi:hypothetical protein
MVVDKNKFLAALGATGSVQEHIAGRPGRKASGGPATRLTSRAGRRTDPSEARGTPILKKDKKGISDG